MGGEGRPVPAPGTRRALREAARRETAPPEPPIERLWLAVQGLAVVLAVTLSGVSALWLNASRPAELPATGTPALASGTAGPGAAIGVAGIPGPALALVLVLACLLLAPMINPFYVPPHRHRWLYSAISAAFTGLALSTVAVVSTLSG